MLNINSNWGEMRLYFPLKFTDTRILLKSLILVCNMLMARLPSAQGSCGNKVFCYHPGFRFPGHPNKARDLRVVSKGCFFVYRVTRRIASFSIFFLPMGLDSSSGECQTELPPKMFSDILSVFLPKLSQHHIIRIQVIFTNFFNLYDRQYLPI